MKALRNILTVVAVVCWLAIWSLLKKDVLSDEVAILVPLLLFGLILWVSKPWKRKPKPVEKPE